jgi:hypothetical protein
VLKEELLRTNPAAPNAAAPALLSLRGRRLLGAPEVEANLTIRAGWIKNLSDPTSEWTARGVYGCKELTFRIPALLSICTNTDVDFTRFDGGLRRRLLAVDWPVHFTSSPSNDSERQTHTERIKLRSFYTPERLAGYLYVLTAVARVFQEDGRKVLAFRPVAVKSATEAGPP